MTNNTSPPETRKPNHRTAERSTAHGRERSPLQVVSEPTLPEVEEAQRPYFAVYTGWVMMDGNRYAPGVWWHGVKHSSHGDESTPVNYRLCDPLFIDAETVDTETGHVGRLLRFRTRRGQVEWVMPQEALVSGDEVLKALFRLGLVADYKRRKMVLEYIASQHPTQMLETTTRVGWHPSGAFVLPNRIFGSEQVKYQDTGRAAEIFSARGDLDIWKSKVAPLCDGNAVLVLSICCALTGPLLARLGIVGGGFHLVGDSSSGKSLAQRVAATVWGNPDRFAASWAVTKNGLEIEAAARNETVLLLDEIKRADPRYIQEMAYALANGMGKGTMTAERGARQKLTWLLFFLSSGERPLAEHAALSGSPAHAGAELRMVDINAGTRKFRAFDNAHGMSGEEFHRSLSVAVMNNYGHLGPALIEEVIAGEDADDIPGLYSQIRSHFDSGSAQAGRVADRFCAVATAGEYAISKGLLPWRKGVALSACKLLFNEWRATVGAGNTEDRQILQGFADFIAAHGDSRFSSIRISEENRTVHNRAGYFEPNSAGDGLLYLFSPSALQEAAQGFSRERILLALEVAGALMVEPGTTRNQKQYRTPGGDRRRFYVIDPDKLQASE